VWGVDIDPVAVEAAQAYCEDIIVADLNTLELSERFGGRKFDVVLMLDVLEHLVDPVSLLRNVSCVVADGGWGIISLPNVAHASVRLALLEGRFTYTDVGLLDRTHLRFFDRSGVDELLHDAGWEMFDLERVTHRPGATEIPIDGVDPQLVSRFESDVDALTYQFVVSAAPSGSASLVRQPVLPAAVAYGTLLKVIAENRGLQEQAAAALADHKAESFALEAQLEAAQARCAVIEQELECLRRTKLFRWAAPARNVYGSLRHLYRSHLPEVRR
jgi:hypothetical protein